MLDFFVVTLLLLWEYELLSFFFCFQLQHDGAV